jgi:hypothetical protein
VIVKILQTAAKRVGIVVGILGIQAFWLLGTNAFAQQASQVPVPVTNGKTNQVNVHGPVNIGVTPYQVEQAIADSSTCAPQCILRYTEVPQGQRLVITHVSAQLNPAISVVILEGGNGTLFVTKPYRAASHLSAQTTFYYEAGQAPSVRMYVPDTSDDAIGHTSLIVTLIGHLVPSQ